MRKKKKKTTIKINKNLNSPKLIFFNSFFKFKKNQKKSLLIINKEKINNQQEL